jgi:DNA-binding CsgD family transcriptional regulator/tetratricopeptide (TPR) repeat protein
LRAQIAFASNRGSDAPPLLLEAAKRLEPLDVTLARETYLEAYSAAVLTGRLATGVSLLEVAQAARSAPQPSQPPGAADLLLDGHALLITEGYPAGTPVLKRALRAFRSGDLSPEEGLRWLWLACRTAMDLWDDESWYVLSARQVQLARDAGALTVLPGALALRGRLLVFAGEFAAADELREEAHDVTAAIGTPDESYSRLVLAAWQGDEARASELLEATLREAVPRGEGIALTVTQWARAVLYNGLGRYEDALPAAEQAMEHPEELAESSWGLIELVEAATRSGRADRAADALERLSPIARASGGDWALGIEARSRALLSANDAAEALYREAIERLARTRVRVELARAHLLYGEWLRRESRRLDARGQLRTAHEMFAAMGAEAFAGRAARELLATGETARKRTIATSGQLTAQEAQIAGLARDGLTNSEIAARLFISPRTVEYHMHKVFAKLNISSRHQIDHVLSGDATPPGRSEPNARAVVTGADPPEGASV